LTETQDPGTKAFPDLSAVLPGSHGKKRSRIPVEFLPPLGRYEGEKPSPERLLEAFTKFGTYKAVGRFFGVHRTTVQGWTKKYLLAIETRPEMPQANYVRKLLEREVDRVRVAQ
jgi:hypothetical protein